MSSAAFAWPVLTRAALAARQDRTAPVRTPPIRIVHMGIGAFHRAHQAWYTATCDDAAEWGIAAFTGRSPVIANQLRPQDGLYCLIERSASSDDVHVMTSVVEVRDGADLARFAELLAAPQTAIVTLTVTEAGYRVDASTAETAPVTPLARLLYGLAARRDSGAGAIAVVPCDNLPGNATLVRDALLSLAETTQPELAVWIEQNVSFVSTSVDRITPATTPQDVQTAAELSRWRDAAPVVTEPFSDWVLSGEFPAGRPAWQTAGARFVSDIEPFERRKLWLLNGAHSLLAYTGLILGHRTVAEAIADPELARWVDELWNEASQHLAAGDLELAAYRKALLSRFANARIEHLLAQIGGDGVAKLSLRVAPVTRLEREAGRSGLAGARAIGAWAALCLRSVDLGDTQSAAVATAIAGAGEPTSALVALIDSSLAADEEFMGTIRELVGSFT